MSGITSTSIEEPSAGTGEMHQALFYRDAGEYVDGVMQFAAPALAAGEPVAVAVPKARGELLRDRLTVLRDRLTDSGAEIEILDMIELGRNPARIIPDVETILAKHDGELLHYIGEPIWPGRSQEEIREATKHEALINLAWPGARIRVLCPYDAAALSAGVLADVERTHPGLISGGEHRRSVAYRGPTVPLGCDEPLSPPPPDAVALTFGLEDLVSARALVSRQAGDAGMRRERVDDLVLAVNELVTNAVWHGDGGGVLHVWSRPSRIVCQVDNGGDTADPLARRHTPVPDGGGGLGLWTVNQLSDLVEVRSSPAGTSVRVHASLN
jgi:anti-sigma regulatory factor (Ser/Thr protein kinase)